MLSPPPSKLGFESPCKPKKNKRAMVFHVGIKLVMSTLGGSGIFNMSNFLAREKYDIMFFLPRLCKKISLCIMVILEVETIAVKKMLFA